MNGLSLHATYELIEIDQNPIGRRAIPGSAVYDALITGTRNAFNTSGLRLTPDQIIPEDFWDGSTSYVLGNDRANIDFVRARLDFRASDAINFRLIAGYRGMFALGGIDLDGSPALSESENGGDREQLTLEPQIFGDLTGSLSYIVGYYYFNDEGRLIADTTPWALNNANPSQPFRNHIVIREEAENTSSNRLRASRVQPDPAARARRRRALPPGMTRSSVPTASTSTATRAAPCSPCSRPAPSSRSAARSRPRSTACKGRRAASSSSAARRSRRALSRGRARAELRLFLLRALGALRAQ